MDLFASRADDRLAREAPLATRVRPRTLSDMVGQEHLLGPDGPLRKMAEAGRLHSMVVWGPPGVGKTTLARVLAAATDAEFVQLSATSAGVKDVREVLEGARRRLGENGRRTVLFLDEIHRFSRSQQDALLPGVEEGIVTLIGATTENPYFEVNSPLLSRASLFRLEPLTEEDVAALVRRAAAAPHGLDGWEVDDDAVHHLADKANGDVRQALNALELAATLAGPQKPVTLALAEEALQRRAVVYDKSADQHYDMVSAFIKSMRGSDPDASLYYLRRMLGAGEDPEFLARRMVILASEDIGNADPQALLVAVAAAHALSFVGLPEAEINLSHAALYLASAPKSNAVIVAMGAVGHDLEDTRSVAPPAHLRDTHYRAAARLGHGKGYRYPHDHPDGVVAQQYLPDPVAEHVYYRPTRHGAEADVADRLAAVDRAMGRDADRRRPDAE